VRSSALLVWNRRLGGNRIAKQSRTMNTAKNCTDHPADDSEEIPAGAMQALGTEPTQNRILPGSAKGMTYFMSEDFDEPLDEFAE
jgi:hypothetical protein